VETPFFYYIILDQYHVKIIETEESVNVIFLFKNYLLSLSQNFIKMSNTDRSVRVVGPVEISGKNGMPLNILPARAQAVVIASKTIYNEPGLLYIGTDGDVAVIPWDDPNANTADPTGWVVFKGLSAGDCLPVYVKRVGAVADGTSATDIVVCF
jgi:hypothetical protein